MDTFSALLAICAGNSPVTGECPAQRPVTRSFDVFYLRLNKRLSKQSRGWWIETLSRPLWRHCNGIHNFSEIHINGYCPNFAKRVLQWRHNERDGVTNQRHLDCLLGRLFINQRKHQILCERNTPVDSPHKLPVTWIMCPFDDVIMRRIMHVVRALLCFVQAS